MATRRIISQEKTLLEKDDTIGASPAANEKSNISPAVPTYGTHCVHPSIAHTNSQPLSCYRSVIMKLLAFTLGMIVIPIGSYFLTVNTLFRGMFHNILVYARPPPHPFPPPSSSFLHYPLLLTLLRFFLSFLTPQTTPHISNHLRIQAHPSPT
jgi:hypothetical protein